MTCRRVFTNFVCCRRAASIARICGSSTAILMLDRRRNRWRNNAPNKIFGARARRNSTHAQFRESTAEEAEAMWRVWYYGRHHAIASHRTYLCAHGMAIKQKCHYASCRTSAILLQIETHGAVASSRASLLPRQASSRLKSSRQMRAACCCISYGHFEAISEPHRPRVLLLKLPHRLIY